MKNWTKKKCKNRSMLAVVWLMLLLLVGTIPVYASEQTGSVELNKAKPGTEFSMYRIREGEYPVDLSVKTSEEISQAAAALVGYILRDQKQAEQMQTADDTGHVIFQGVSQGLYLILASDWKSEDGTILTAPSLIYMTDKSISVDVKTELRQDVGEIAVYKIWKSDRESSRPVKIEVQLLKDGVVADQVTLEKANNWMHRWNDLEKGYTYKVVEKQVPSGYQVSIGEETGIFTICNTSRDEFKEPKKSNRKLPQTGQLWWPISFMAAAGLICLTVGVIRDRERRRKLPYEKDTME